MQINIIYNIAKKCVDWSNFVFDCTLTYGLSTFFLAYLRSLFMVSLRILTQSLKLIRTKIDAYILVRECIISHITKHPIIMIDETKKTWLVLTATKPIENHPSFPQCCIIFANWLVSLTKYDRLKKSEHKDVESMLFGLSSLPTL